MPYYSGPGTRLSYLQEFSELTSMVKNTISQVLYATEVTTKVVSTFDKRLTEQEQEVFRVCTSPVCTIAKQTAEDNPTSQ